MIDKVYQVREYDTFPKKRDTDEVIREFKTLEEAQFESIYLNRKARMGKKYYAIDYPHKEVKLTDKQKKYLEKHYGLI